jgi:hypothetical protein
MILSPPSTICLFTHRNQMTNKRKASLDPLLKAFFIRQKTPGAMHMQLKRNRLSAGFKHEWRTTLNLLMLEPGPRQGSPPRVTREEKTQCAASRQTLKMQMRAGGVHRGRHQNARPTIAPAPFAACAGEYNLRGAAIIEGPGRPGRDSGRKEITSSDKRPHTHSACAEALIK